MLIVTFVSDLPSIKATRQGEISTLHVVMHNAVDVGKTGGAGSDVTCCMNTAAKCIHSVLSRCATTEIHWEDLT